MATAELEHDTHNPARGRQPRADETMQRRRKRRGGTLNRMAQFKLDFIDPENLDLENYVYRWVNDEPGKLRAATKLDDYDHVPVHELGESFDQDATDSESSERVRVLCGTDKHGNPIHTYLLKKPRDFWLEDNEEIVRAREDMMAGRVYRGETTEEGETRAGGDDKYYVTKDTSIGHAAERRRGPIPRGKLK